MMEFVVVLIFLLFATYLSFSMVEHVTHKSRAYRFQNSGGFYDYLRAPQKSLPRSP